MKTPEFWTDLWSQSGPFDLVDTMLEAKELVEAIQKDALADPWAQTLEEEHVGLKQSLENMGVQTLFGAEVKMKSFELQASIFAAEAEKYKTKWHDARRYLRAANRGAERNNMVMRLQAETISKILSKKTHERTH